MHACMQQKKKLLPDAIHFGNFANENDPVTKEAHSTEAFRLLARLGTEPKVYYKSKEEWVRGLAEPNSPQNSEVDHG
jgi:molybdopterin-containing oxidoreductase family iron-sulfur binding subunit